MSQAAMNGPKNGPPSKLNTQRLVYRTRSRKKYLLPISKSLDTNIDKLAYKSWTMLNPMTCGAVFTKPCSVRKAVKDA